jgi:hypothetical protein
MKKVMALIVSLMLLIAFTTGCKQAETPKPQVPTPPETAAPPPPETAAEAPAPGPPEKEVAAPDVVVVPSGTGYVYMAPDRPGLYFYHDYWYRFHERRWYRTAIYGGPWIYIETSIVPLFVVNVPPDYIYHLPHGYYRIHYRDLHRDWRTWDRSRHWHRYEWYKREFREHERRPHGDGHKPPKGDGHKPHGDGHKPHGDGHKPHGDGHKPKGDGHKPKGDGHKPPLAPHQQQGQDRQRQ